MICTSKTTDAKLANSKVEIGDGRGAVTTRVIDGRVDRVRIAIGAHAIYLYRPEHLEDLIDSLETAWDLLQADIVATAPAPATEQELPA